MHPTPAGFWRRMGAHLIDFIIISIVVWLPLWLIAGQQFVERNQTIQLVTTLLGVAYYVGFLASKYPATPGKRVMGVYVVKAGDHMPLDHVRAALRYIVYMGPYLLLTLMQPSQTEMLKNIPLDEQRRYEEIQGKMHKFEKLSDEEMKFMDRISKQHNTLNTPHGKLALLALFYSLVQALLVAFTKDKTGLHDLIVKTRAVRGRPGTAFVQES